MRFLTTGCRKTPKLSCRNRLIDAVKHHLNYKHVAFDNEIKLMQREVYIVTVLLVYLRVEKIFMCNNFNDMQPKM